jgi:tight adherence protein B
MLTYFVIEAAIPFFINTYSKIQAERTTQLQEKLEESFIFWEKKKMFLLTLAPLVFAGIGFLLFKHPLSLILGFLLGFGVPNFIVMIAKQQRLKKFRAQLVDSLMILSSSLKAGLSFIQAMEVLCEEMPAPISQEFNLALKENKWGMSLDESLRKLRDRVPLEEVNLLVSSILIAREAGGELTKVFSRLTETIRNNLKLKEKIATLTLQGRLQGLIMMFLPFGFAYFVYRQDPHHFDIMLQSQLGRNLLIAAMVAQITGMVLIKKISTIKT